MSLMSQRNSNDFYMQGVQKTSARGSGSRSAEEGSILTGRKGKLGTIGKGGGGGIEKVYRLRARLLVSQRRKCMSAARGKEEKKGG